MNKFFRRITSLSLAALLFAGAPTARAAAPSDGNDYAPGGAGVVGEAAKAVVDRVFGVKGEAADIKYHAIELSNHSPVNAGIRSALLPGWGQQFNRQPVKAAALFMVITVGAFGAVKAYHQSNDDYNKYKSIGNRNDSSFDDYGRHRTQAYVLGGATLGLWVYSIFDAYRYAYNPLWSREHSVEVALLDDGAGVQWHRKF